MRLLLHVGGAAVPELRDVERRVVDGRRVATAALAPVAGRRGLVVDPERRQEVARVARDVVILREPNLVVEHSTQLDLRLGNGVGVARGLAGERAEDLLGSRAQLGALGRALCGLVGDRGLFALDRLVLGDVGAIALARGGRGEQPRAEESNSRIPGPVTPQHFGAPSDRLDRDGTTVGGRVIVQSCELRAGGAVFEC